MTVFRRTVASGGPNFTDHRNQQVQMLLAQFKENFDKKNVLLKEYDSIGNEYSNWGTGRYQMRSETLKFQIDQINTNLYMIRNILQDYAVNKQVNGHLEVSIPNIKDI